jgi:hypothetical protein
MTGERTVGSYTERQSKRSFDERETWKVDKEKKTKPIYWWKRTHQNAGEGNKKKWKSFTIIKE